MNNFLFILLGIVIGGISIFFYFLPRVKKIEKINKSVQEENLKLEKNKNDLNQTISDLNQEMIILNTKKESIINNIEDLKTQSIETEKVLFEQSQAILNEQMDAAANKMSEKYSQAEKEAQSQYLKTLEDCSKSLILQIEEKRQELLKTSNELEDLSKKVSCAVKMAEKEQEKIEKQDFYRLKLEEQDIKEISKLKEVSVFLRDKEPLNKVIWKVYYEKPYTDLIGRVVGSGSHTGIYKITNINNQMCYVGQAVNIGR